MGSRLEGTLAIKCSEVLLPLSGAISIGDDLDASAARGIVLNRALPRVHGVGVAQVVVVKKDCRRIATLLVKLFVDIVLLVDGLDVRDARYLAEARDNKVLGRVRYLLELLGTLLENNSGVIKGLDISQIVEQLVQLVGVRLNLIVNSEQWDVRNVPQGPPRIGNGSGEGVPRGSIERLIIRIQVVLSCVNLLLECVVLRLGLRGGAIEGVDRLIDNPAEELDEDLPIGRAGGSQAQAQGQTKGSVAPHRESTCEEGPVRQVRKLKAEVAYLKIDCPAGGEALSNRGKAPASSRSLW